MCKSAALTMPSTATDLLCRTAPYNPCVLNGTDLDASSVTSVEFFPNDELYKLIVEHISKVSGGAKNFTLHVGRGACNEDDDDEDMQRTAHKSLGLGMFRFTFEGNEMHALHQTLGDVVGTDCGATLMKSLVLFSPDADGVAIIKQFADCLLAKADATTEHTFTCYRWHVQYKYWQREEVATARPLDSVVLPAATKQKLVSDLDDFVSPGTKKWYAQHGIPYKRSLLLHGSPGAGKTSLIQALAGRYRRNLAILTPSHPEMTDDGLKAAIQRVPNRSIIVLEDVDAIFSDGRSKRDGDKSSLTFSGVLNALDGVGRSAGQIFILTTNHREKLDPALIRNGRVDCHVEFTDAAHEQARDLFLQFYQGVKPSLAEEFATALFKLLDERKTSVSMAALQHYFILMRKASAEEAASGAKKILEEAEAHGKLHKEKSTDDTTANDSKGDEEEGEEQNDRDKKKVKKKQGNQKGTGDANESDDDDNRTRKGVTHVHVHMH